jgi:glycosyltransferase involved in cell wall biosynthesis
MSKKILSISMVKNEEDIIESFVRYNINIFDGIIILDNGSTDDTLKILKQLQNEGLSLIILEDKDREYKQADKMNMLLKKAVNELDADIIVPLDADEFLIATAGGTPRSILESMGAETYYLAMWKTYIPEFGENKDEKFIPSRMTAVREDKLETFYKAIFPKELVENYNVELTFGNHDLSYEPKYKGAIKKINNNDLRIAHFPIRSKDQTISKITVGWIYSMYRHDFRDGQNFHWKNIFDKLKENEEITDEDVINFAKQFALQNEIADIIIKEDAMDLSFCKHINVKYTLDKINPISNLLEACEWLAKDSSGLRKKSFENERKLKERIDKLSIELNNLRSQNRSKEKKFKSKINEYENSTSWSITAPLRKFSRILRR